jgi:hypothetical protein
MHHHEFDDAQERPQRQAKLGPMTGDAKADQMVGMH